MITDSKKIALQIMNNAKVRLTDEQILDSLSALTLLISEFSLINDGKSTTDMLSELRVNKGINQILSDGISVVLEKYLNLNVESGYRYEFIYALSNLKRHEEGYAISVSNIEVRKFLLDEMNFKINKSLHRKKIIFFRNNRKYLADFVNEFIAANFFKIEDFFTFDNIKKDLVKSIINGDSSEIAYLASEMRMCIDHTIISHLFLPLRRQLYLN
jgi:hypothetical protein